MIDKALSRFAFALYLLGWLSLPVVGQDSLNRDYADQLQRIPPRTPAQSLEQFELDPKLRIELVACEPMVRDPVAVAFDEHGRAFVVEMRGYSEQAGQMMGQVKLLEDSDQDGSFDRATVFAERFRWPTAVVCAFGGILVGDAPDIIYLRDTDQDGRADVRQVLFTGFGTSNVQQLPNNFQWGIDNRIYGSSGGNGGRVERVLFPPEILPGMTQLAARSAANVNGRDFVINPVDLSVTGITGGSQFGMTFDRYGSRFICSNSNHCQQVIIEDRYAARNRQQPLRQSAVSIASDGPAAEVFRISPVEPWRKVRTRLRVQGLVGGPIEGGGRAAGYFTSATGITCYDGDLLPAEFSQNLLIGDVGSNLVHRKRLVGDSIQRSAVRQEADTEFLRSRDNWFRPVQMANAPDGSLVVIDMYRETIEHPASLPPIIKKHLDLNSGNDRGRIYRIVPAKHSSQTRLWPGDATPEQLVQMLQHQNGWHRRTAARLLFEQSWTANERTRITQNLRGQTGVGLSSPMPEARIRTMYLLAQLELMQTEDLRSWLLDPEPWVRVHALRLAENRLDPELERQISGMTSDSDVRVRFQVALTLGEMASDNSEAIADLAVSDGNDRWFQEALANSAHRQRGRTLECLLHRIVRYPEKQWNCRSLLLGLAAQIARSPDPADLKSIARVLKLWPEQKALLLGKLLQELNGMPEPGWKVLQAEMEPLDLVSIKKGVISAARKVARNRADPIRDRLVAVEILSMDSSRSNSDLLEFLLQTVEPPAIKTAAIEFARQQDREETGKVLLKHAAVLNPQLRTQVLQVLAGRPQWTEQLLTAIQQQQLDPVLIDAATRQRLMLHETPAIREFAQSLLADGTSGDRTKLTNTYLERLQQLRGNEDRGRALFRKSCANCHRLENFGAEIGPNLVAFSNRGVSALVTNILDPNREVDPRFLSYQVLLEDGRTLLGVIESESETTVVLQDAQGKSEAILRTDIEAMKSTTLSLMPENLEQEITPQGMADLIEYVMNRGG